MAKQKQPSAEITSFRPFAVDKGNVKQPYSGLDASAAELGDKTGATAALGKSFGGNGVIGRAISEIRGQSKWCTEVRP